MLSRHLRKTNTRLSAIATILACATAGSLTSANATDHDHDHDHHHIESSLDNYQDNFASQTNIFNISISDLWQASLQMTDELRHDGLLMPTGKSNSITNQQGIGGSLETDGFADLVIEDENDNIAKTIENLSEEVQLKEDKLAQLAESLSDKKIERSPLYVLAAYPVRNGRVTSNYGYRKIFRKSQFHKGIDIAAPYGTPVYATGDGVVTFSGTMRGYGRVIKIDHGNGLETRYAHNSRLRVSVGSSVKQNDVIADVGCSGRCTGPHTHYEVRKQGKAINPNVYLALAPIK